MSLWLRLVPQLELTGSSNSAGIVYSFILQLQLLLTNYLYYFDSLLFLLTAAEAEVMISYTRNLHNEQGR